MLKLLFHYRVQLGAEEPLCSPASGATAVIMLTFQEA